MTQRSVIWLGRGLVVLGLAIVAWSIVPAFHWAVIAGAGGALIGIGLLLPAAARGRRSDGDPQPGLPTDFLHVTDLLRRAHQGRGGWIVGTREGDINVGDSNLDDHIRGRGYALAQLAAVDERAHVSRESDGTYVAVGSFPYGAAILLGDRKAGIDATEAATDDLRRLVATLARVELDWAQGDRVARQLAQLADTGQTIGTIAAAAAMLAEQVVGQPAAVVIQESGTRVLRVQGVSPQGDRRMLGFVPREDSPVGRAIAGAVPVVTAGGEDIFGPGVPERRQRERTGSAHPLVDGHFAIGALVLAGPPIEPATPKGEQVGRLLVELGSRLAAARAVHEAQERAIKDMLTGLYNRREFERRFEAFRNEIKEHPAAAVLVYVDIDHFKRLNDSLGHPAGDSALQHMARILEREIRDGDLVARVGGEEFAVWLPRTPLARGLEVAGRIRGAVAEAVWRWEGGEHRLTVSCGVAGYPETSNDINNLRALADAALYQAKQQGRNRVEMARAST